MKAKHLFTSFLIALTLAACAETSDYRTVEFNANTTYSTNAISPRQVKIGSKVKKPSMAITGENPDKLKVYAWYQDKDLTKIWDFKHDTVQDNMTLYAQWKKTYTVNYYLLGNDVPSNTVTVFEGETIMEHPEYASGFRYLGTYTNIECTDTFNFESGVTSDMNLYIKKSDYIDIYEGSPSSNLYDNIEIFSASNNAATPEEPEIGNISRTSDKSALKIDFGYSPDWQDPYIELGLNADISHSPVLHFEMKYLGAANTISIFFTTINDISNYSYSVTGKNYNENFKVNYTLKDNEKNMSEDDEYVDVAIDLSKCLYNGYSVWGTSSYLGKIRIQTVYRSTSPDDRSNVMILRRIYGGNDGYPEGVITEDSQPIKDILVNQSAGSQVEKELGFVFPKNNEFVTTSEYVETYTRSNGLLMHFENEIAMRKKDNKTHSVSIDLPLNESGDVIGDKIVALKENKTLYITLQNYGYSNELRIIIKNDYNGKTYRTIKLDRRMSSPRTYCLNLARESLMINTLAAITLEYESVGVDNAILLSDVYFGETKPADIEGISFDDKKNFSLSGENVAVSYNEAYYATEFNVAQDNAYVSSLKKDIKLTNAGYYGLTLQYSKPKTSEIEGVYLSMLVNGSWSEEVYFETPNNAVSKASVEIDPSKGGHVTNVKFRFKGTGIIRFSELVFDYSNENALTLSRDMSSGVYFDWIRGWSYSYDDSIQASTLIPNDGASSFGINFYLGIGNSWYGDEVYNCKNINLEDKSKIIIVYQNTDPANTIDVVASYSTSLKGNPDDLELDRTVYSNTPIRGDMAEYEWDYLTLDVVASMKQYYLGEVSLRNLNGYIAIRMIAVI